MGNIVRSIITGFQNIGCSYQLKFPEYSKYVSGEFDCKEEIIKDKEIADIVCVKCARMLRKRYAGFLMGSGFISLLAFVRSMVI